MKSIKVEMPVSEYDRLREVEKMFHELKEDKYKSFYSDGYGGHLYYLNDNHFINEFESSGIKELTKENENLKTRLSKAESKLQQYRSLSIYYESVLSKSVIGFSIKKKLKRIKEWFKCLIP